MLKDWCDVSSGEGVRKQPGSLIVHILTFLEVGRGKAVGYVVTVVQSEGYKGDDECFGSRGREAGSESSNTIEVERGCFGYVSEVGLKESGVEGDAKVTDYWGGCDCVFISPE